MPRYKYLCSNCGLEFEKITPIDNRHGQQPCKGCAGTAERQVSSSNFTFKHQPTGPVPQNTGVSSIDHNFDRVIGRDAEQRWETIDKRRDAKVKAAVEERRRGKDVHMDHITPNVDGTYRTLTQQEIQKVNTDRKAVEEYNKQLMKKDK